MVPLAKRSAAARISNFRMWREGSTGGAVSARDHVFGWHGIALQIGLAIGGIEDADLMVDLVAWRPVEGAEARVAFEALTKERLFPLLDDDERGEVATGEPA